MASRNPFIKIAPFQPNVHRRSTANNFSRYCDPFIENACRSALVTLPDSSRSSSNVVRIEQRPRRKVTSLQLLHEFPQSLQSFGIGLRFQNRRRKPQNVRPCPGVQVKTAVLERYLFRLMGVAKHDITKPVFGK